MKYIFFDGKLLKRSGGPSTYLYNLRNGLIKKNDKSINFIYDESDSKSLNGEKQKIKKILLKRFPKLYERLLMKKRMSCSGIYNQLNKIEAKDIIMFHMTMDFAKAFSKCDKDAVKVLMSHSPEVAAKQMAESLKSQNSKCKFKYTEKQYYKKFDLFSFKHADVIVFPSKESMEPYYQTCDDFAQIIENKRIEYIETGTEELEYKFTKEEFRRMHNIPEDAFVLCFIGRHNKVKGYDNFIKICSTLLEEYPDFYVLTAGIGEIKSPIHERWIDIGWTNDPGSIANCSDLFILPNKRTYFDLILLEMLSIGKTCLVSNTGGNKTVAKYTDGVITYNDIDSAIEIIKKIYNDKDLNERLGKLNQKIYKERYTIDAFASRYIELMKKLEQNEISK